MALLSEVLGASLGARKCLVSSEFSKFLVIKTLDLDPDPRPYSTKKAPNRIRAACCQGTAGMGKS